MESAELRVPDAAGQVAGEPRTWRIEFEEQPAEGLWFGKAKGRRVTWQDEGFALDPEGGRVGAGLRIGPGLVEDKSRAVMLFPVRGQSRVVVRARVRLEANPEAEQASTRETLRLVEHPGTVEDPTVGRRRSWPSKRVSRRYDPSRWDILETELITAGDTGTLEVQLLHRSGGSAEAMTRFDQLVVEETPLSATDLLELIAGRYRPRDGQEALTPWRCRVALGTEVRDAVLIPTPGELALPLVVPPLESGPQLRLHLGGLPDARRAEGDGARLEVVFVADDGQETPIGEQVIDPKNKREDRGWVPVLCDLGPVAGAGGRLVLRARDVDDEPDELDALLVATPRIEPTSGIPPAFNVLLIGADTLRADRLSALGYERETTPNLAALADECVRFSGARSQAPWTLPSFSSILTSLYPSTHGAGRGGHDEWEPIDPTTLALAEVLSRNGWETVGIVANGLVSPRYGLDQGFDSYRTVWAMESVAADLPRVVDFVEAHQRTPWFLFWHIMDPHLPYQTEEGFREAFTDGDYRGRFAGGRRGPSVPFHVLDPRPGRRWFTHEGPPPAPDLAQEDRRFVSDYYDAEIAEMDAGIGELFDALRASGQWERTVIAFVADHGEGLGDHDHYHHGYTLFDDQVHVPMLLRIPGQHEGLVIDRPVATIDLAPTILGALGIPVPASFQGVDRLAPNAPAEDAFFIEYPTYDSSAQKGWVQGRFKYLHDPLFRTAALYDLAADPGEQHDVSAQHPDVVARARRALDAFRWEHLQTGRFHLRLRGRAGQRLTLRIETDDLFDANFVTRPALEEEHFEMDPMRSYLLLETELPKERLELVFWCRGNTLSIQAGLDGAPLAGLDPCDDGDPRPLPARLARDEIAERRGVDLGWPDEGQAYLWLEAGAGKVLPVVNTPEEIERLRGLGYAR